LTVNRDDLIEKIKALMSKKVARGCTEAEALGALDKARALMDAYEVTEEELKLTKEESVILRSEPPGSYDPHRIKFSLAHAVSKFCDCTAWRDTDGLVFCGLPADVRYATWLLDTLADFVQAELARHLMGCLASKRERRVVINGFVVGCCNRISERLDALRTQSAKVATSGARDLVVIKSAAIADKLEALGISLRTTRSCRQTDDASLRAGRSAGDRASFGRPVSGTNAVLRIK
jgi:Protein of unknown function (DUF2786)